MGKIHLKYMAGHYEDKLHLNANEHLIKRAPFFIYRDEDSEKLIAVPEFGSSGYGHGEASHSTVKIKFYDLRLNKVEIQNYTSLYLLESKQPH